MKHQIASLRHDQVCEPLAPPCGPPASPGRPPGELPGPRRPSIATRAPSTAATVSSRDRATRPPPLLRSAPHSQSLPKLVVRGARPAPGPALPVPRRTVLAPIGLLARVRGAAPAEPGSPRKAALLRPSVAARRMSPSRIRTRGTDLGDVGDEPESGPSPCPCPCPWPWPWPKPAPGMGTGFDPPSAPARAFEPPGRGGLRRGSIVLVTRRRGRLLAPADGDPPMPGAGAV